MVHLTATGVYAGTVLCGKPREVGGRYVHAGYHTAVEGVCQECQAYWDGLDSEETPPPSARVAELDAGTRMKLLHEITEFDRRYQKGNPYALALMIAGLNNAAARYAETGNLETALTEYFDDRLLDKLLKATKG